MKTTSLKLPILLAGFIFVGCSGGGGSSTISTIKVSGTVPGTLIEAFCVDGSYYKTKSIYNNTNQHPFEIEIPSNLNCSLVMTTNEESEVNKVITQIGIISSSNVSGTLFKSTTDVNLGHIPLAIDPSSINDINKDHVSDEILHVQVESGSVEVALQNSLDSDEDGLINFYEDDDYDGTSNHYDSDDDNDGVSDSNENDNDLDGIKNDDDVDDDNDGINDDDYIDASDTTTNILLPTAYSSNAGRLLGSQCAQCHGTNGISTNKWDSIAGEDELENEIFEDDEPIMNAQAHGYTSEEITLIGNWLKTLKDND